MMSSSVSSGDVGASIMSRQAGDRRSAGGSSPVRTACSEADQIASSDGKRGSEGVNDIRSRGLAQCALGVGGEMLNTGLRAGVR